ncbi:MAG: hypothetical protein HQ494_14090 [Rhodospirillales bacterium]|nr:hypothetical protein [Rhodospirillales bacterium]
MLKGKNLILALALAGFGFAAVGTTSAMAYSCGAEYEAAEKLISEAKSMVKADTDSRILAMITEAEGIADAGIISHKKANQPHTGDNGKFMHGDSVRKGRWARSLANQAIFLMNGETR